MSRDDAKKLIREQEEAKLEQQKQLYDRKMMINNAFAVPPPDENNGRKCEACKRFSPQGFLICTLCGVAFTVEDTPSRTGATSSSGAAQVARIIPKEAVDIIEKAAKYCQEYNGISFTWETRGFRGEAGALRQKLLTYHKSALKKGYTGMLDRYDRDPQFRIRMTENGTSRQQIVEYNDFNLREYQQGAQNPRSRQDREHDYGRWRNQDEARSRREQGLRRGYEWTEKQWSEWRGSWKDHHWS